MPTPEAREAFNESQRIAEQMRIIHAQEKSLEELRKRTPDHAAAEVLSEEMARLRSEWIELSCRYTDAVGRFSDIVAKARRGG